MWSFDFFRISYVQISLWPFSETTETENEQANATATADESSNDEPKDQSSDQPPDQPSDQSNDPPTEGHDGIQENPQPDDGVEVEDHSATPKVGKFSLKKLPVKN